MAPWVLRPTIDIDLGRPVEQRLDDVPDEAVTDGQRLLDAVMREAPRSVRWLADYVRIRTRGRFHAEIRTFARRAGVSWRTVTIANVSYDLAIMTLGCSTVALPTPDGPIVARNMDWRPEDVLAQTSYLFRHHRRGEPAWASAGWPGSSGVVTGMSGRGFAVVLNAVRSPERCDKTGYPTLLHIRRVLEDADGFDQALTMLKEQRLASSCLLTLVGSQDHQRVVIERTSKRCALRWADSDQPLIATNDYRLLYEPQAGTGDQPHVGPAHVGPAFQPVNDRLESPSHTSCSRFEAMTRFFAEYDAKRVPDESSLLYILTDPAVIQDITAQHVVMHPRSQMIHLYVPRRLLPSAPTHGAGVLPANPVLRD